MLPAKQPARDQVVPNSLHPLDHSSKLRDSRCRGRRTEAEYIPSGDGDHRVALVKLAQRALPELVDQHQARFEVSVDLEHPDRAHRMELHARADKLLQIRHGPCVELIWVETGGPEVPTLNVRESISFVPEVGAQEAAAKPSQDRAVLV
jgi:hypothetical protein